MSKYKEYFKALDADIKNYEHSYAHSYPETLDNIYDEDAVIYKKPVVKCQYEIIVGDRRYDRYKRYLHVLENDEFWISGTATIGGDAEFRGYFGDFQQITKTDADNIINFLTTIQKLND